MESLITSYGIDFESFHKTMKSLDGIVAGSSALAAYLKQEGIDPGFVPNDLDIFIEGWIELARDRNGWEIVGKNMIRSLDKMRNFLAPYGFTENDKFGTLDAPTEGYYASLKKILKVTSFTNKDNKEIQVIVIGSPKLLAHITQDFDLSACISWWDAFTNVFRTLDPVATKRKEMYFVRENEASEIEEKTKKRVEKYIARGFKLIEKPCPFVDGRDPRDLLSDKKFDDIEVTDIFTLDEAPIRDYLQKSDWNIVLKAGEAHYGFNRKALMDYMSSKTISINRIGKFCETPFNQCISLEGYNQLRYSDYSIYEVKSAYSVEVYHRPKSLFHLHCYSVKEWIDGSAGGLVEVPPKHLTETPVYLQPGNLIGIDDILAAHAHLMVPANLEAFHAAMREINGST